MNNNCPSSSLLVRLGLFALLATSVACAHESSATSLARPVAASVGPGGKGVWLSNDELGTRSAPNFADRSVREPVRFDRSALPPTIIRR